MKTFKKINALLFLLLVNYSIVNSQNPVDFLLNHSCNSNSLGSVELIIDPTLVQEYPFPYFAEWENITNGDFATFQITSVTHLLSNMEAGDYEIEIQFSLECIYQSSVSLQNSNLAINGIITEPSHTNREEQLMNIFEKKMKWSAPHL